MFSSSSNYLSVPSFIVTLMALMVKSVQNGNQITNTSVVNDVGRVGLKPNDDAQNSIMSTTNNNFKSDNTNNNIIKNISTTVTKEATVEVSIQATDLTLVLHHNSE